MSVSVEYVEGGFLFTGHFLAWSASWEAVQATAKAVAPEVKCEVGTIERILQFELSQRRC